MKTVGELARVLGLTPQAVRKMRVSAVKLKMEKISDRKTASFVIGNKEFERVIEFYEQKRKRKEDEGKEQNSVDTGSMGGEQSDEV